VNIRIILVIKPGQFINDFLRLLGRGCIVKICKRFLVDYASENREVKSDPFDVVRFLSVNVCCRLFLRSVSPDSALGKLSGKS